MPVESSVGDKTLRNSPPSTGKPQHRPVWSPQAMTLPPRIFEKGGSRRRIFRPLSRSFDNWRSNRSYYDAFQAEKVGISVESWRSLIVQSRPFSKFDYKVRSRCDYCKVTIDKGEAQVTCATKNA